MIALETIIKIQLYLKYCFNTIVYQITYSCLYHVVLNWFRWEPAKGDGLFG